MTNIVNGILLSSIQKIQQQVDVLHTISMVCLVLMILLFIVAAVEFFLLDIFRIILIKSGRAAKMGIRELEAENSGSGRLAEPKKKRHNMWNTESPLKEPKDKESAPVLEDIGSNDTALLGEAGSHETSVLSADVTYDYSNENITMPLAEETPVQIGKFLVIRNIMMIHTDEVI